MTDVLITVDQLRRRMDSSDPLRILDVRWQLGGPPGREAYLAGHIPGAVFVDLDHDLAAPPAATQGRHPLPDLDALQRAARSWGLSAGETVVAYDDNGNMSAARAWWLLRWASLPQVLLLDGGLAAWTRAGGALQTGEVRPPLGDIELTGGAMPTLSVDQVDDFTRTGFLLDARAGERYRGEVESVDPIAGHIPGAISAPTDENLTSAGTFRRPEELAQRFAALGAVPGAYVGAYCGSGVTAAHEIAALAIAGIDAYLYPGSWSQWSNLPDRPVATGP